MQPASATLVVALGWQWRACLTRACLAMAEIWVYRNGRDPVPCPARACWGNCGSHVPQWDPFGVRAQTWGQPMAEGADLPSWLSLKPAVDRDQHSTSRSSLV